MHACEDFIMQMAWSWPSRLAVEALRARGAEANIEITEGTGHCFDWYLEGIEESVKRSYAWLRNFILDS